MSIREQITQRFPVRRTPEQKAAFRQWIQEECGRMGYQARVEDNEKHQNVIIGDPENAKAIFTAHYDTPVCSILPNLMTPRNRAFHLVWQIGMILLFVVFGSALGVPIWLLTDNGRAGFLAGYAVYMFFAFRMLFGPANPNNVNDNTSGVAAVLELMERIPEDNRRKLAFILFDNEEKGLRGSRAYAKAHPAVKESGFVVNLDCVGNGEHVLLISSENARAAQGYAALTQGMESAKGRQLHIFPLETSVGNSDHRSFRTSSVVYACSKMKGIGYYCDRIHTKKDTVCEQANLDYLAEGLSAFAAML